MKELAALFLVVVALLSLTACVGVNKDDDAEAALRADYALHLSENPTEVAKFLSVMGELDNSIEDAAAVFATDREIFNEATSKAKEVLDESHLSTKSYVQ